MDESEGGNGGRMDILTAIRQRMSTRSYDADRPVEQALLARLVERAQEVDPLAGTGPRVELVSGVDRTQAVLTSLVGSYGLLRNVPHLLVGILPQESPTARIDLGYVLEQVVLEATRLEISTCWVTGTYDARQAGQAVGLAPGEVAAAVCALGYPDPGRWSRIHDRTVRRMAGGHQRKPLEQLVFSGRWGAPWEAEAGDSRWARILEYARLAPSATNRQPWRFVAGPDTLLLALKRPAPIDGGIVMAHVALAAAELGRAGRWQVRWQDAELAETWGLPPDIVPVGLFK